MKNSLCGEFQKKVKHLSQRGKEVEKWGNTLGCKSGDKRQTRRRSNRRSTMRKRKKFCYFEWEDWIGITGERRSRSKRKSEKSIYRL